MSRRERYLETLGIELWRIRGSRLGPRQSEAANDASTERIAEAPAAAGTARATEPAAPARDLRALEAQWQSLRTEVAACRRCALCEGRTQTVFGVGNPQAELLVIGEAPGAEEDRQGEPFVGRAGQLLNAMLRAMGNPRETVYIANVLKCRPPGNRDPRPEEAASCRPFLQRQLDLLQPRLILAVGRIAAQNLLQTDTPIGRLRGRVHPFGPAGTPLIVTYHPAYLLRSPAEKRKAWDDLKFARRELAALRSAPVAAA